MSRQHAGRQDNEQVIRKGKAMNLRNAFGRPGAGRPLTEDEPLSETLKVMLPPSMRRFIEERARKRGVTLGKAARGRGSARRKA